MGGGGGEVRRVVVVEIGEGEGGGQRVGEVGG